MVKNAIKSDFRSSKMAAGGHFVQKFQKKESCVLIWNGEKCDQMWFSVIQNGCWWPFSEKNSNKIKVEYWSEMARNAINSDFWPSNIKGTFNYHMDASKNKTVAICLECLLELTGLLSI